MASLTPEGFFTELLEAGEKLRDFVEHLTSEGKISYFKDIALKLRVIYLDKSGTKALLKTVLAVHHLDVRIFVTRSMEERVEDGTLPASLLIGQTFSLHNTMINWFQGGDFLLDPFSAIERPDLLVMGKRISIRRLIETVADKQSAHIDPQFPDEHLALQGHQMLLGELPVATRLLLDSARVTIQLIEKIEQAVVHQKYSVQIQKVD